MVRWVDCRTRFPRAGCPARVDVLSPIPPIEREYARLDNSSVPTRQLRRDGVIDDSDRGPN